MTDPNELTIDTAYVKIKSGRVEIRPTRSIHPDTELTFKVTGSLFEKKITPNGDGTANVVWVIEPLTVTEIVDNSD